MDVRAWNGLRLSAVMMQADQVVDPGGALQKTVGRVTQSGTEVVSVHQTSVNSVVVGQRNVRSDGERMLEQYAALGRTATVQVEAGMRAGAPEAILPGEPNNSVQKAQLAESSGVNSRAAFGSAERTLSPGHQLMLDRLFGGTEPPLRSGVDGMSKDNFLLSPTLFLNAQDRRVMAEIYDAAHQEGVDLQYVDDLAVSLGNYRQHDDGRTLGNYNQAQVFDQQGRLQTVHYNAADSAVVQRIQNSASFGHTRLDQGFLRFLFDPGTGALSSAVNFEFLERVVDRLATQGSSAPTFAGKFQHYQAAAELKASRVFRSHGEPQQDEGEVLAGSVDGVWHITEKGRAAGITEDMLTGRSKSGLQWTRNELNASLIEQLLPGNKRPDVAKEQKPAHSAGVVALNLAGLQSRLRIDQN